MFGVIMFAIVFSLKVNVSITKSRGRCDQDTFPLSRGLTSCIICCKVCKSFSRLKRLMAVHKKLSPSHASSNINSYQSVCQSSLSQDLQDCCWTEKSSKRTWSRRKCQPRRYQGIKRLPSANICEDGVTIISLSLYIYIYICLTIFFFRYDHDLDRCTPCICC